LLRRFFIRPGRGAQGSRERLPDALLFFLPSSIRVG